MTQKNTQSVRSNAEAVNNIYRIPTFEEVYAMPYVQKSIECLIAMNNAKFPYLTTYQDDIRQEMLIFLAFSLKLYDASRSDIKTFCRMKLESGLIRARRAYHTCKHKTISTAVSLDKILDNATGQRASAKNTEYKAGLCSDFPFEKEILNEEFQIAYDSLHRKDQIICDAFMNGLMPRDMFRLGICTRSALYERAIPTIKKAFKKNLAFLKK